LAASGQTLDQAKRAFEAQQYAEAARLFEEARQQDPACEISFYLGITRYRLHQVDSALIAFQEAVKCNPKLTLAYIALGEGYAERGNDGEALAAYERALRLEPENAAALRGAAALYLRAKLNEKAVAALELLVKQEPADAQAHADLGAAYFGTSNLEGSEREFEAALKLNPKFAAALIVHQFGDPTVHDGVPNMIQDKKTLKDYDNVELVINGDGLGNPASKIRKYNLMTDSKVYPFIHFRNIKIFFLNQWEKRGHFDKPPLSLEEIFGIKPLPGGLKVLEKPNVVIIA